MPLDDAYLVWLYSQVGSVKDNDDSQTYWTLLKLLYSMEFTWSIENDENRAQDGKDLRREFLNDTGTTVNEPAWLDYDCTVLELLIALSWKLAFEGEGEPRDWFWQLINNLGLTGCTDANPPEATILEHIINKVLARDYAKNGAGGLFPLSKVTRKTADQREVELWYQAQAYLLERI